MLPETDYSTPWAVHGRIQLATVSAPDVDAMVDSYAKGLRFHVFTQGRVTPELAALWGASAMAGKRWVLMGPDNPHSTSIRIVEGDPLPEGYAPLRTFGWGALEMAVLNVMEVNDAVAAAGFRIVGVPADRQFSGPVKPMQAAGLGGEMFFLTEIRGDAKHYFYPRPLSFVDQLFIAILSTPDRRAAQAFYENALGFPFVADYEMAYTSLNKCMGLPVDTPQQFTMVKSGKRPAVQIDQMPPGAAKRPTAPAKLPPGIAMITFLVDRLEDVKAPLLSPPQEISFAPYAGSRSACVRGAAGELIELIEIGACGDGDEEEDEIEI